MTKIAFLGLGVMGYPMAAHLKDTGHEVTVYNRTTAKAEAWVAEHGGAFGTTPAEAVKDAEIVMTCVGNDDDLRMVCAGEDGAFSGMSSGAILVDHTTVSAMVTRELAAIASDKGLGFVDAPISGGQAGAENGVLSIMCGGPQEQFDKVAPVLDAYAKICRRLGESGAGQLCKSANQIAIAGVVQGLSEALLFAEKAGLSITDVVEVISQGAAGSWQMANRSETMAKGEYAFGFAVDWMRKDLDICLNTAEEIKAPLPMTALVDQFYKDVQTMGGGRWDTSALIARLRKLSKNAN
ncbi:NAD(P)-dependent oxidoreductase [Thioclava kandeliae]|uniref:NAD(P)-dependent oxidoreductase n=1 Tax=Thioclava kandeliae TaxID=3070818 RepID=A0ABV1SB83_9RHOB